MAKPPKVGTRSRSLTDKPWEDNVSFKLSKKQRDLLGKLMGGKAFHLRCKIKGDKVFVTQVASERGNYVPSNSAFAK